MLFLWRKLSPKLNVKKTAVKHCRLMLPPNRNERSKGRFVTSTESSIYIYIYENDGMYFVALQWRHNERDGVANHRRLHCLLNCWFRCRSKKTSKLPVTGLCAGNSPVTGGFLTKGQKRGKCFYLMTSSWDKDIFQDISEEILTLYSLNYF